MANRVLAILDSIDIYGKERANIQVYELLKKNGYEVDILYNVKASENLQNCISEFNSVPVPFPRNVKGNFKYLKYVIYWIKSHYILRKQIKKNNPQYILVPTEIALLYLFLSLFFSKSKVVFRMGDDPIALRFFKKKKMVGIYHFIWKNIILNRVDKIVCNAIYIKNNLIISGRKQLPDDVIIYNYPPKRKVHLNEEEAVLLQPFSNTKDLKFGYIGRVVEEKGVYLLVESALLLLEEGYNFKLLIAGDFNYDPVYSEKLKKLLAKSDFSSQIVFLGEIKDSDSFYHSIDVLCVPSIYNEPSANVVVEAKSCSRGSILFNTGGTPELIKHLVDGYICENVSTESLKKAMLYYLNDIKSSIEQGKNAFDSINSLGIDYESFERKWLDVFK